MRSRTIGSSASLSPRQTLRVVAVSSLLIAGCSGPRTEQQTSPAAPAPAVTSVTSPVSINAEMVTFVDHAAHQLWNVEKEGMAPKTDADWNNLAEHATQIAAAGALIRVEGSGVNDRDWVQLADWQKFAAQLSSVGTASLKAIEAKNLEALVVSNGQLVDTCEACHHRYKPQLPSEGITHSHFH